MRRVELKEYKKIILKVLVKIDEICRDNNLRYCLAYGTLLGAVRHQGFIPWDDDIDIAMPLDDYNKLAEIIQSGNFGINFIRVEENETTCFPFGKVCDINTILEEGKLNKIRGYGAYVDVFPFVSKPDKFKKMSAYWKYYHWLLRFASYSKLSSITRSHSIKVNIGRTIEFLISRFVSTKRIVSKINHDMIEINNIEGQKIGLLWEKTNVPIDIFINQKEVVFEGHLFCGTKDPNEILTIMFGDYMTLPPEEERVSAHGLKCYICEE